MRGLTVRFKFSLGAHCEAAILSRTKLFKKFGKGMRKGFGVCFNSMVVSMQCIQYMLALALGLESVHVSRLA